MKAEYEIGLIKDGKEGRSQSAVYRRTAGVEQDNFEIVIKCKA